MNKSRLIGALSAVVFSFVSLPSHAILMSVLGGEAIYDSDADLTWLLDANAGAGSVFDDGLSATDGRITWASANAWAASLDINGVTGWRLPTTLQPDLSCDVQIGGDSFGFNCTGSEMGNLFYNVLGNTAGSLSNTGPFSNVQSHYYWSSTEYAPNPANAWFFYMFNGSQNDLIKSNNFYAWAVQSGNVDASVPEPSVLGLFAMGLFGLLGVKCRQRRR